MTPPPWSRAILRAFCRGDLRDAILDDLDEVYTREVHARGVRRARWWYRGQVIRSVPSLVRLRSQRTSTSPRFGLSRRLAVTIEPATRHALRRLRATPGFAAATMAALGLALSANLIAFTLVDSILIHPLRFPHADELVDVGHRTPGLGQARAGQSHGGWLFYRRESTSFAALGVYNQNVVNLTGGDVAPERVNISMVSPDFFRALDVAPLYGRVLGEGEEGPNVSVAAILSYGLWTRRYGADPTLVGRSIEINGVRRSVIGVMPPDFAFPSPDVQLWIREGYNPNEARFGELAYGSVGRLKPGITAAQAEAELNALVPRLPDLYSDVRALWLNGTPLRARVEPLQNVLVGDTSASLWIALAAAGLMLILTGANVANLFLIRSERRLRETGICLALGASGWALLLTSFAESVLVCLGGAALAVVVVPAALRLLAAHAAGILPRIDELRVGPRGWLWLALLVAASSIVLALVAHWRSKGATLHDAGRGLSASRARARARHALAAVQVALAFALVAGAGLLGRSFWNLATTDIGFDSTHVQTFQIDLPFRGYDGFDGSARFYHSLLNQLRAIPGVVSAGGVTDLPLSGYTVKKYLDSLVFVDRPGQAPDEVRGVHWKLATAEYFDALRIPIKAGHWFAPGDHFDPSDMPLVVSANFARRHLGDRALGQRIRHYADPRWCTVVGVVGDVRDDDLRGEPAEAVYVPVLDQTIATPFNPSTLQVAVRTTGSTAAIVPLARRIVNALDPKLPLAEVQTLDAIVARARARDAFITSIVATTATLAVMLGMIGLYAALAYSVSLRRHELSIRVALGATIARLTADIARPAVALVGAGLAAGLAFAWVITRAIGSLLFAVDVHDGATFAAAGVAVLVVALLAVTGSLRRLRRVNAVEALKAQ